ncbi:MAG: hypothetical protein AAGI48_03105 [Verrucomicrobiota bacterium]
MKPRQIIVAALVATACSLTTAHAFLLEDGSFETPIASFDDLQGWEAYGTPDIPSAISREDWANGRPGDGGGLFAQEGDGQFGLAFRAFSASTGGFFHDVPVEPGRSYDFTIQSHCASSFYNQVVDSGTGSVEIVFDWYDGDPNNGGVLVSSDLNDLTSSITDGGSDGNLPPGPSQSSNWQDWSFSQTAPAGSAYLRLTIQWIATANVTGGDEAMRWDNAELTTTLDPLNESVATGTAPRLSFDSQEAVTYTVESSPDLSSGFADAGEAPIMGTGGPIQRVVSSSGDRGFFRLNRAPNFSDGEIRVFPAEPAYGNVGWQGFMNVFNLPENGGGFIFSSEWGIDDLVSDISTASTVLTLSPNTIGDPNEFWYQNTTGTAPDPVNPGGPGQRGNKTMEANLFLTFTDSVLSGQTVTFSGTVLSNSFTAAHSAEVFIKDFSPDFSSNTTNSVPLVPGPFSISLATDPGAGRHIQFGFVVTGENVWITDTAPFGKAEIAIEPFTFEETPITLDLVASSLISWDGQLGVRYRVEFSDNGGGDWAALIANEVVGTGNRMEVADPAGQVSGRTYRVVVAPAVP